MDPPRRVRDRETADSVATAGLVLSLFGVIWAAAGAGAFGGAAGVALLLLALAAAAALCVASIRLRRSGHNLPRNDSADAQASRGRMARRFNLVVTLQWVAIVAAIIVLGRFDRGSFIPPVIAVIVGLHFFPLARLFRIRAYHVAGAALCLVGLIALWAPPATRLTLVGLGSAAVLFATAAFVLIPPAGRTGPSSA